MLGLTDNSTAAVAPCAVIFMGIGNGGFTTVMSSAGSGVPLISISTVGAALQFGVVAVAPNLAIIPIRDAVVDVGEFVGVGEH